MKARALKILFVAGVPGNPEAGGAPTAIRKLGEKMRELGHSVDYLFADEFSTRIAAGPLANYLFPPALALRLARIQQYDVLDITSGDGILYLLLHRSGALRKGRAIVVRSHGSEHKFADTIRWAAHLGITRLSLPFRIRFFGLRLQQVAWSLRLSDQIICCTASEASELGQRLSIRSEKFSVIAHGTGDEFLQRHPTQGSRKNQILFVGNWVWNKGIRMFPSLFSSLLEAHPGLRFVIAGSHLPEEKVRQEFPSRVRAALDVFDSLPATEVARLMAESKLMVFPSDMEGFGLVALEAMALGTPVVMSRRVGLSEWLNGRGNSAGAMLVEHEPQAYLEACRQLLTNESLRRRIGADGVKWARGFTWERAATQTLGVYEEALALKGGA